MKKLSTKELTTLALLIALSVVCSRMLSLQLTPSIKISSTFIILAITGATFGPVYGAIAGATADILGMLLFPSPYGYFFGFTVSAFVDGAIYGLLLYKRPIKNSYIITTVILSMVIVSSLMNTCWVSIMRNTPFLVELTPRIIKNLVIGPIQIIVLIPVMKLYQTHFERLMK